MNLNVGDQLGPYRVAEPIGAGGMGRFIARTTLGSPATSRLKFRPNVLATGSCTKRTPSPR